MDGICSVCGLMDELCLCEDRAIEQQSIRIYSEKRRYGKVVTVVEGITDPNINRNDLAKKLKAKCASGGTVKGTNIELQGEHKKKVQSALQDLGFQAEIR